MKLPPDLENFVRGAGDKGVVIFSLGTLGDVLLRQHHIGILASAFGRLKQRVVWRLTSKLWEQEQILQSPRVYTPYFHERFDTIVPFKFGKFT